MLFLQRDLTRADVCFNQRELLRFRKQPLPKFTGFFPPIPLLVSYRIRYLLLFFFFSHTLLTVSIRNAYSNSLLFVGLLSPLSPPPLDQVGKGFAKLEYLLVLVSFFRSLLPSSLFVAPSLITSFLVSWNNANRLANKIC